MVLIYYRGFGKKLCSIKADTDDHKEAIESVIELLKEEGEKALSPVLAVIQGGAHG